VQRPEYDAQFRADMAGYIGLPLLRRGRPDLFEPLMRQDGDDLAAHFPRSGALARTLVLIADAWIALGRYDDAAKAIANAQDVWRAFTHGVDASSVEFETVAASLALATGRAQDARQLLVEGQRRWDPHGLSSQIWRWRFESRLAQADLALGDTAAAGQRAAATLTAMNGRLGSAALPALEADLLLVRGMAQHAAGKLEAASSDLERAVQLRQAHDDTHSLWLAQAQVAHGACLVALNRKPQARTLWEAARRIHAQHREVAPHLAKPLEQLRLALAR
jgi:tetratricopeptide (TPR) repeat protein